MSEDIIQSDYEACDELLRVGASRNTFIEANCERNDTWREFADLGDPRGANTKSGSAESKKD